jgi:hypothetical protein
MIDEDEKSNWMDSDAKHKGDIENKE